jgi:hypothetical protein
MKRAKDSNPAGAKLKQRAFRGVAMTLTAILGFYGASTSVGYLLGRARSPDWSDSTTLTTFVYNRHSWRLVAPASQTSPVVVELSIRAGDRQYVYRSDTDEVRSDFLSPGELAAVRRPILSRILSRDADRAALLSTGTTALSATGALAKASGLLARLKWKQGRAIAVGVAIVGGGAALGFFMGHKGEPDYGSANFQSALMNSDRWRAAAKQYLPPAVMPANTPDASPHR